MKRKFNERILVALVGSIFEIDARGRVWRVGHFTNAGNGTIIPNPRRRAESGKKGYLRVFCSVNGKRLYVMAHRLVWQYFRGDIPDGLDPNHEDGVKSNNNPSNLTLLTMGDNIRHAFRVIGTRSSHGENHSQHLITEPDVVNIREMRACGHKLWQISGKFGISQASVSLIARRKRWTNVS